MTAFDNLRQNIEVFELDIVLSNMLKHNINI